MTCHLPRLLAATIAASACVPSASAQTTSGPSERCPPRDAPLSGLAADAWPVRERAQSDVTYSPEVNYDAILDLYQATSDYDARLRLKRLTREAYLDRALGTPGGFLGIAHSGRSIPTDEDGRVPPYLAPVAVGRVFPQTAAGEAGLRVGDLIIAVDGVSGMPEHPVSRMLAGLRDVPAGRGCRLLLVRGGGGEVYPVGTGRLDRATIGGCGFEVAGGAGISAFCGGGAALRLTQVLRSQGNTGLRAGDLLVALDGRPLSAADPLGDLAAWVAGGKARGSEKLGDADSPNVSAGRDEQERTALGGASAQFLRDVQLIEVGVRLGRRPLWAIRASEEVWGVERAALDNALAAFDGWWRETFAAGDNVGGWADADRFWRLRPVP